MSKQLRNAKGRSEASDLDRLVELLGSRDGLDLLHRQPDRLLEPDGLARAKGRFGEAGVRIMTRRDEADFRIQQGIHQPQVFLARDTKDVLHTLVFQTADKQFRCLHMQAFPVAGVLMPVNRA